MEHIEVERIFATELSEGFSRVTEIANWPKYFPGFVRLENPKTARWREPGDKATVVLKILGRERTMHMELERFEENAFVQYRTRQEGLPDAQHERYFHAAPGGFQLRAVVFFEPRRGLAGLIDRVLVKRGVERTIRTTFDRIQAFLT